MEALFKEVPDAASIAIKPFRGSGDDTAQLVKWLKDIPMLDDAEISAIMPKITEVRSTDKLPNILPVQHIWTLKILVLLCSPVNTEHATVRLELLSLKICWP